MGTNLRALGWMAVATMIVPGPARAEDQSLICGIIIPCRNFEGALSPVKEGAFPAALNQRLILSKLSKGTIFVVALDTVGDGAHTFRGMTWDFYTDDGKFSSEGRFTIYSDIPDLGGTNKIGRGRCVNRHCSFEYKDAEMDISETLDVLSGSRLKASLTHSLKENGKVSVGSHQGTLELDEK